jgi:ectoine hydroxylase-related dioxygenase (phytanoyl-CoA dioxygenase family)
MKDLKAQFDAFQVDGFAVLENVYSPGEINLILAAIDEAEQSNSSFRRTRDLFAIRRVLKEIPSLAPLLFNQKLKQLINAFGSKYFLIKSIYFDKPERSNWFVAWHQDLTISVERQVEFPGFTHWTKKFDQYAVQPPVNILESSIIIRIHLDNADENNGALKVIPGSHSKGVLRAETIDFELTKSQTCPVEAGGILLIRPLLMHASDRTISNNRRRVIHLEFNSIELPGELEWAERMPFN